MIAECLVPPQQMTEDEGGTRDEQPPGVTNPWDEEVSILNVTTKSFGVGERGWVGRTVKLRTVAARWCMFESLAHGDG